MYYLQSRYYNPEWGRFINADGIVGQVGELLGHNLFIYCRNNPTNMSDHGGFRPIYTVGAENDEMMEASIQTIQKVATVQQLSSSAKSPTLYKRLKEKISNSNGTVTVGVTEETSVWLAQSVAIGISFDYKGNIAVQFTGSIGSGSPNISGGVFRSKTNAPDITKLEGLGNAIGGSIGEGICGGGDFLVIPNSEGGYYYGNSVNAGIGARLPLPGEAHYLPGYTVTLYQINIFDMIENFIN